jgi:predicted ABC-type ATPase
LLLIIAGHNGAGKSTCYKVYLQNNIGQLTERHIDPDVIENEICREWAGEPLTRKDFSYMAMKEAEQSRILLLDGGASFSFETVFSDTVRSKLQFMEDARQRGYFVALLFVGLSSPEKSLERVTARHQRGGHSVPEDRIHSRYPRVLTNAVDAVKIASLAILVDNSIDSDDPENPCYDAFAVYADGQLIESSDEIPLWAHGFDIAPSFHSVDNIPELKDC